MTTILNVIWLLFSGFWLFLGYMLAAVIMFVLIITIPWGIAAARVGGSASALRARGPARVAVCAERLLSSGDSQ
ncbi:YccF domain-containing protein [Cryobacterium cryoconiti]|uniref:Inner membrane component domain-containing protein n=1 Tax=Cryobacterium cryoconiti TaxID=1259239 RepID=A0A4Y8JU93_9MICO|nr:hypothetical protein E3T49_08195 [Cryobacterium cryoconiti]